MYSGKSSVQARQILISHYRSVLRKATTWVGLVALLGATFIASPAAALGTQMGARSVTPGTLKAGATSTYTVSFKAGSAGAVGSMWIYLCDSPLESVGCANNTTPGTNSYGDSFAGSTVTVAGTNYTGGTWTTGAKTGPAGAGGTGVSIKVANGGVTNSPTTSDVATLTISNVVNPTGNNQRYYLRVVTYSDIAYTTERDFGGMALQTAQDLTVTASVQEQLAFCVGATVAAGCASVTGGSISLTAGGGTCPILTISNVCTNTSQMAASTNASAGYTITYNGTTFTAPSGTITAIGSTVASSTPGTEQFGLAGTAKSGSASGTFNTAGTSYDYATNGNKYAYVAGSAQTVAGATVPTAETVYTVTYMGNVTSLTEPGLYTATLNYVCTGLF